MRFKSKGKYCLILAPLCIALAAALWGGGADSHMFPYSGFWGNEHIEIELNQNYKAGNCLISLDDGKSRQVELVVLATYKMQNGSALVRSPIGGEGKPNKKRLTLSDFRVTPEQDGAVLKIEGLKVDWPTRGTDKIFSGPGSVVRLSRRRVSKS